MILSTHSYILRLKTPFLITCGIIDKIEAAIITEMNVGAELDITSKKQ